MVNSPQDAEAKAVLAIAERYFDLPNEELEIKFEEALSHAESKGLPHRGSTDTSFWKGALVRLKKYLAQQEVAASATSGLAAAQAVSWAHEVGLDLTDYQVPIAILVALAVKATWEQLNSGEGR